MYSVIRLSSFGSAGRDDFLGRVKNEEISNNGESPECGQHDTVLGE